MHGVASEYHGVTIYPLVDALSLLLQKPTVYCFLLGDRAKDAYKRVLTNFDDEELFAAFEKQVPTSGSLAAIRSSVFSIALPRSCDSRLTSSQVLLLCLYRIESDPDQDIRFVPYRTATEKSDIDLIAKLFELLRHDDSAGTARVLETLEHVALERADLMNAPRSEELSTQGRSASFAADVVAMKFTRDEHRQLIDRIRILVIGAAIADLQHNPLLGASSTGTLTNAFCVVRRAIVAPRPKRLNAFDFTAQIILAPFQQAEIRMQLGSAQRGAAGKTLNTKEIGKLISDMEAPLGKNYRSIADSVFGSGMTDFTYEPYGSGRDACRGDTNVQDEARRKAEELILSLISENAENTRHIFYFAVHVGGAPWIAFFSLAKTSGKEITDAAWEHNYHLYRFAPQIANRLRIAAQHCYREELAKGLADAMTSDLVTDAATAVKAVDTLNSRWRALTEYFPYRLVQLRAPVEESVTLGRVVELPHGLRAEICTHPNPNACFARRQLEFDPLDVPALTERLSITADRTVAAATKLALEREAAQIVERADLAHASKNIMNNITSLIRTAKDPLSESDRRGEALWLAEEYSLFVGQDAGVLQQIIRSQSTTQTSEPLFSALRSSELEPIVVLCLKYITAVNQLIHAKLRRYFVADECMTNSTPSRFLVEVKKEIKTLYRRHGVDLDSSEWKFKTDPIFCQLFFTFREVIDNMRPRSEDEKNASRIDRYLDVECVAEAKGDSFMSILLRQRVPRTGIFVDRNPFSGADTAESIDRFNRRYGPQNGLGFAVINSKRPEELEKEYVFEQEIRLLKTWRVAR